MGVFTTASKTWAVGNKVTAADLNGQLRDFVNGFGALTTYTPTLSGFTLGNGTMTGRYAQVQKLVYFEAYFVMGSTSAAASAAPGASLPVTASANAVGFSLLTAQFTDQGTNTYRGIGHLISTTVCNAYVIGSAGVFATPSTTSPFTWSPASGDAVGWGGFYWAA